MTIIDSFFPSQHLWILSGKRSPHLVGRWTESPRSCQGKNTVQRAVRTSQRSLPDCLCPQRIRKMRVCNNCCCLDWKNTNLCNECFGVPKIFYCSFWSHWMINVKLDGDTHHLISKWCQQFSEDLISTENPYAFTCVVAQRSAQTSFCTPWSQRRTWKLYWKKILYQLVMRRGLDTCVNINGC